MVSCVFCSDLHEGHLTEKLTTPESLVVDNQKTGEQIFLQLPGKINYFIAK